MSTLVDTDLVDERLSLEEPEIDLDSAQVAAVLATLVAHRQVQRAIEDHSGPRRWRWSRPGGGWPG